MAGQSALRIATLCLSVFGRSFALSCLVFGGFCCDGCTFDSGGPGFRVAGSLCSDCSGDSLDFVNVDAVF